MWRINLLLLFLLINAMATADTQTQVRLVDPLDEPEYYCLDLSGWGPKLKPDDPVQAHTCKLEGGDDQQFQLLDGRIGVGDTDRCLELAATRTPLPGSAVLSRTCSDNPMQSFRLGDNGRIELGDTGYCLAVGADSTEAFGPSHVWRVLSAQNCATTPPERSTWQLGL